MTHVEQLYFVLWYFSVYWWIFAFVVLGLVSSII